MDEILVAFIGGSISGSFVAIFSSWLANFFSERRRRKDEFNKAASEFRATFVDEIFHIRRYIETVHEIWGERPVDIAIANEKAKIIFEFFLPCDTRSSFNSAWEKYINCEETGKKPYSPLNPEHRKEIGAIRLSHIKNLLEFAKPKI